MPVLTMDGLFCIQTPASMIFGLMVMMCYAIFIIMETERKWNVQQQDICNIVNNKKRLLTKNQ